MSDPDQADVARTVSRQMTFIALAAAPSYMAIALVRFTTIPVLGWVLLVLSTIACAILVARATAWLRAANPQLRSLAYRTLLLCVAAPVISTLAILFLPGG